MLSAPVDLGPVGAQARNEPGRLQASSKIENSVVTTGSNILLLMTGRKDGFAQEPLKHTCQRSWQEVEEA